MNSRMLAIVVGLVLLVGCRPVETTQLEPPLPAASSPALLPVYGGGGETPEGRSGESTATPAITVVTSALEAVTSTPESDNQARETERPVDRATGPVPTPSPPASVKAPDGRHSAVQGNPEAEVWVAVQLSPWPASLQGTVLCLIQRESRGVASAVGGAGEAGLMQIHPIHAGWLATLGYSWGSLFDPATNIAAAWELFKRAGGLSPWGGGC